MNLMFLIIFFVFYVQKTGYHYTQLSSRTEMNGKAIMVGILVSDCVPCPHHARRYWLETSKFH